MSKTVAAISTPRGTGGIAIIRISGDSVREIMPRLFMPRHSASSLLSSPRRAIYGDIIAEGSPIDSGIAVFYPAPGSYTGEDMAEISCHGGEYVTRSVLEAAFAAGCECAAPGEFTRRAFINGKMSLSECEAVGALIEADTEEKMRLASSAVRGRLSGALDAIYTKLYDILVGLYAAIDYPDEEIDYSGDPARILADAAQEAERLAATYKTGRAVTGGVSTVICGKPNSGKSSLYNALIGEKRAIVTPIAGTTRDVLESTVSFAGITLRLADTAGLRVSEDAVEQIGIELAWQKLREAELVLAVYDISAGEGSDRELIARIQSESPSAVTVAVFNKSDIAEVDRETVAEAKRLHSAVAVVSAERGELSELEAVIRETWNSGRLEVGRDAIIWEARQYAALVRARELIAGAVGMLAERAPADAICSVCENALSELGMIDGRGVCDEIISGIFSKFCVGK